MHVALVAVKAQGDGPPPNAVTELNVAGPVRLNVVWTPVAVSGPPLRIPKNANPSEPTKTEPTAPPA